MRKLLLTLCLFAFSFATTSWSSVYIRYYNKDMKDYKWSCVIGTQTKVVEFGSNRSSSLVIPGSGDTVIINCLCGKIQIKSNSKIVIQDGCIKIQYQTDERDQGQ